MSRCLRAAAALALTAAAALLGGCNVPDPEGAAPLRYRDQVFPTVKVTERVVYGSNRVAGQPQDLLLDLYEPSGDTATKRPVVIWTHGGAYLQGSRRDPFMVEIANRFARRGYVVASIDYRLLLLEVCPDLGPADLADLTRIYRCAAAPIAASEDQKAAVRWMRRNAARYRIDPSRIAVGGESAGGGASLLTGATPENVGSSGNAGFSNAVKAVVSISAGIPPNPVLPDESLWTPGDPPVLFWHGTADPLVPYQWAYDNARYMNQHGLIAVMHDVNGAGHVPWTEYGEDMDRQSRNFLYSAMGLFGAEQGGFPR